MLTRNLCLLENLVSTNKSSKLIMESRNNKIYGNVGILES